MAARQLTLTFERKGSKALVIIRNIPVTMCLVCGESSLTMGTQKRIDDILRPFHGHHGEVPKLPPSEILVDFDEVEQPRKAA